MFLPPIFVVLVVWMAIVGVTGWAYVRQTREAVLLEVDELHRSFKISHPKPGTQTRLGSLNSITGCVVTLRTKRDSDGDIIQRFAVSLHEDAKAGRPRRHCLVTDWDEMAASQLRNWLQKRLELRPSKDRHS